MSMMEAFKCLKHTKRVYCENYENTSKIPLAKIQPLPLLLQTIAAFCFFDEMIMLCADIYHYNTDYRERQP